MKTQISNLFDARYKMAALSALKEFFGQKLN